MASHNDDVSCEPSPVGLRLCRAAELTSVHVQHDNAVSKFDSPYTPGVDSAPGPPLSTNPAIVGESTVTPAPIAQQQPTHTNTTTTNVIHNPEYTPTSPSTADETVANDSPTKLEQAAPYAGLAAVAGAGAGTVTALPHEDVQESAPLDDSVDRSANDTLAEDSPSTLRQSAPYAGAAAVAGAGAATALPREDIEDLNRLDETANQNVNETGFEDSPSTLEKAAPYAGAAAVGGAGAAALHSRESPEDAEEAARLDNSPNRDVPGVTEALDGKRKGAEAAAGAALGAAGGATGVEAVKQAGGGQVSADHTTQGASKLTFSLPQEDVDFPAKEDPAAALAAQLAGKVSDS